MHIYIIASASLGVGMSLYENKEVQATSDMDERANWLTEQLLSSKESEKLLKERLTQILSDNDRLRDRVAHLEHELLKKECQRNLERYQALIEGRGPRVDK